MHEYKVNIIKVVDGDTVDVDIDLGFGIWLKKERVRIMGIDTPESRTSDKLEKVFGLAAKERLISLLGAEAILQTQVSKKGEDMKGKFGRILGNFTSINGEKCAAVLVREGHAVYYTGGSKGATQNKHLQNRHRLVREGKVVIPEGLVVTKPALVQKPIVEEVVEPAVKEVVEKIVEPVVDGPIVHVKTPTTKKKTKAKKK
jgi:micrococcal nuclease